MRGEFENLSQGENVGWGLIWLPEVDNQNNQNNTLTNISPYTVPESPLPAIIDSKIAVFHSIFAARGWSKVQSKARALAVAVSVLKRISFPLGQRYGG